MWTRFFDMHSGGDRKLSDEVVYVEGNEATACERFERLFGRNPFNVTCQCCGEDFSVTELTDAEMREWFKEDEAKRYSCAVVRETMALEG